MRRNRVRFIVLVLFVLVSCGGGKNDSRSTYAECSTGVCQIGIRVVHVKDSDSTMSTEEARIEMISVMEFLNANFSAQNSIASFISITDPFPELGTVDQFNLDNPRFKEWKNWNLNNKHVGITLVIDKPLTNKPKDDFVYIAGRASSICDIRGLAVAHTISGYPEYNRGVMKHELIHLLGGRHLAISNNIMSENIESKEQENIVLDETRSQVETCLGGSSQRQEINLSEILWSNK